MITDRESFEIVSKTIVMIVVVALFLLAVALSVLLVPSTSWAGALEWFMNPPPPCGCVYTG
jgi:hypothetical protein